MLFHVITKFKLKFVLTNRLGALQSSGEGFYTIQVILDIASFISHELLFTLADFSDHILEKM